jgi:lipoprotein-anchoring transpeptidase ErfK/SrfK
MTVNKGASVQMEARPATGQSVLSRNKQLLLSMTASLALLAGGLVSSAEAFPFDWPSRSRYDFGRQDLTAREGASARMTVAAREKAADKTKPAKEPELASKAKGVLTIVVSIDKQHLTLYSDGVPIAHSSVSTGTPGHPTPTGVFSIIQKDRWHHSNIYGNAPMYFMQRITWSGVAMHEGVVPNHPASHGCIRLPGAFARQLWGTTKLGVRVIVTHGDLTPAEIADARLFTRKPAPVEPPANVAEVKPSEAPPADTSQQSSPAVKPGDPALDAMAYARLSPRETQTPAAEGVRSANLAPAPTAAPAAATKPLKAGPVSVFISRKEGKLFVRKGFDPVFDMPVTLEQPDRPLGTHVFTALAVNDDNTLRWNVMTVPTGSVKVSKPSGKGKKAAEPAPAPAPASSATEALSRVTIPADALDRISELMSAGASLIISDQGLGPETGKGTDFIVLTR